jgi:hypothetical protein
MGNWSLVEPSKKGKGERDQVMKREGEEAGDGGGWL